METGGTIYVRSGTYKEKKWDTLCYDITKDATIQAYNGEAVTLTYPDGDPPRSAANEYATLVAVKADVTLDGLTFIGTYDEGDSATMDYDINVSLTTAAQGAIRNCTFQKWSHAAIKFAGLAGQLTIEKNKFAPGGFTNRDHHIYPSGDYSVTGLVIRHNSFNAAYGYAVHMYVYPTRADIYGNVIFNCVNGGIVVAGNGHRIYNNTLVNNGPRGIFLFHYGLDNLEIKNNIARGHSVGDIVADLSEGESIGAGSSIDYNNYQTADAEVQGANDTTSDPQFVTTPVDSFDDVRLTNPGSPLIDAGDTSPFDKLLDPTVTDWPTPKTVEGTLPIGAFASE